MDGVSILVVDDDAALLRLTEKYLSRLGYQVAVCRGAQEALIRFGAAPGAFALVLVDLSLRDLAGDELARRILAADDRVRVLLWSGYPYDLGKFTGPAAARVAFLAKPFSPGMLGAAIGSLLEGERQVSA